MRRHEDAEGHYTDSEVHYTDFTDAFTAEADFPNLAAMPWPRRIPNLVPVAEPCRAIAVQPG